MTKIVSIVLLLLFFLARSYGQIVIEQSQLQKMFTPGDSLTVFASNDTSANVGQKGGPNVYDFSPLHYSQMKMGVTLGSANPVVSLRFGNDTLTSSPNLYQVIEFSGERMISPDKVKIPNDSMYEVIRKVPGEITLTFPITLNESWSYSYVVYDTLFTNGTPTPSPTSSYGATTTADGYGTLVLPGGDSLDCLRLVQKPSGDSGGTKTFFFVAASGVFLIVDAASSVSDVGTISVQNVQILENEVVTSVMERPQTAVSFALGQNYPNPFNPSTVISYQLAVNSDVTLKVYDILGREVAALVNERKVAGTYQATFDASRLASGVYFYRLEAGNFVQTKKLELLK